MLVEILIILLIIFVVLLFFLLFRPLDVSILFKNNNLDYDGQILLKILLFYAYLDFRDKNLKLKLSFNIQKKEFNLFSINLNEEKSDDKEEEEKNDEEEDNGNLEVYFDKIKRIALLIKDSQTQLSELINKLIKIIYFNEATIIMDFGLNDNNLTIKICNIIWALTAPFYPLNLRVLLTPKINQAILATDININLKLRLLTIIQIALLLIKTENFREIIKIIQE